MRLLARCHHLTFIAGIIGLCCVATQTQAQDAEKIERLEQLIKAQQQQLELLQQQVNELKQTAGDAQTEAKEAKSVAEDVESRVKPSATAEAADVQAPDEKVVTSGQERVKLGISGWVNRAVNIVDDGKDTKAYFVDNDNSESRVRFDGTAKASDDLTLGSTIELTIAPNKAGEVSQINQETNNIFDQRIAEVTLDSKRFGKLSLGKGHTASYGSSSVDLSRTGVISYAEISDLAGGMLYRQQSDGTLTDLRIVDTFSSYNGLFRLSRVRYDTPTFYGFRLAGSIDSDERYDGALRWGGQGYGFKAAGAAAAANPNKDDADRQYDGSFSVLHQDTGLNLTFSAGFLGRDNQDDAQNYFAKVGWIKRFFSVGDTAFSVDYTRSLNFPTDQDDGYSVAVAAVQQFHKFGTELYGLYRLYSLDRGIEPSVDDISVLSIGTRIKF